MVFLAFKSSVAFLYLLGPISTDSSRCEEVQVRHRLFTRFWIKFFKTLRESMNKKLIPT